MIRQAQSYLTGAASSAGLVAAAVVGFILLVWINPFHGVPLPSLGFGPDTVTPASERTVDPATHGAGAGHRAATGPRAASRNNSTQSGSRTSKQQGSGGDTGATPHSEIGGNPGAGPAPQGPGREDPTPQGGGASDSGGPSSVQVGDTPVNSTTAANAANGVVDTADQATGGALDQTGVTDAAHGVVNGTVGPGSTAGSAVDGAVGAVGGALGNPGSH